MVVLQVIAVVLEVHLQYLLLLTICSFLPGNQEVVRIS